eukprot:TRINITY_DN93129_c0_g1_i1.p1 TRINITY_DN93129_c0_g1~~TRINITY_DN93129_c0_g1_i1.p1  ORF type:complete len:805 (-),score=116.87 TRINITY_DN93129_c0_g1_i1:12-2396(-)
MGNYSSKRQLWLDGHLDELLAKIDDSSDLEIVLKSLALFAKGDAMGFLEYTDDSLARFQGRSNSTANVVLPLLKAILLFITRGGLQGRRLPEIEALKEQSVGALAEILTKDERQTLLAMVNECSAFFEGLMANNQTTLVSCVKGLGTLITANADFAPILRIVRGLANMKLYRLRHNPTDATSSLWDAVATCSHYADSPILRDLWINPIQDMVTQESLLQCLPRLPEELEALQERDGSITFETLGQVFVGQRGIADQVKRLFDQRRKGLLPEDRALVLWFSGASGQGKTYMANLIAQALHETASPQEDGSLVVINCQNLRTEESVNSLVDPPTGIQGRGPLISGIESHNNAVVVLDELDKAVATAIENTLLPAFERNGYLKSPKDGRVVRTVDATFVITSNIGADTIDSQAADYITAGAARRQEMEQAWKAHVEKQLSEKYGKPFLNRATANFFLFVPLTTEERKEAVAMELRRWSRGLYRRNRLIVLWSSEVVQHFANNFDQFHGDAIVKACANAAHRVVGDDPRERIMYLFLRLGKDGTAGLQMETLTAVLRYNCTDPDRVASALEGSPVFSAHWGAARDGGDKVEQLVRVLTSYAGLEISRCELSPRPKPDDYSEPLPQRSLSSSSQQQTPRRKAEPEVHWEKETAQELSQLRELLSTRDAEIVQLKEQVSETQTANDALVSKVAEQEKAIETLQSLVRHLQVAFVSLVLFVVGFLWLLSWFVPLYVLLIPLLLVGVAALILWPKLTSVLAACFDALIFMLGPRGFAGLGAAVILMLCTRSASHPFSIGCRS